MQCRICNQPIVFVKGLYPGHKRRATMAIHESDAQQVMAETNGEIVNPHPGMQRRLRQPLEEGHGQAKASAATMQPEETPNTPTLNELPGTPDTASSLADLPDRQEQPAMASDVLDTSDTGTVLQISDALTFQRDIIVEDELAASGQRELAEELEQYNGISPELSAGDIDADWHRAESSGEETPGGHAPTPDQDNVDEIGRAVGMELQDDQELRTHEEIFAQRDRDRWELKKSSAAGDSI